MHALFSLVWLFCAWRKQYKTRKLIDFNIYIQIKFGTIFFSPNVPRRIIAIFELNLFITYF